MKENHSKDEKNTMLFFKKINPEKININTWPANY